MPGTEVGTRNWILRKFQAGMTVDELEERLAADGDDPDLVREVLAEEGLLSATDIDELPFLTGWTDSLKNVFGIEERWFRKVSDLPPRQAAGYATLNAAVPVLFAAATIGGTVLSIGSATGTLLETIIGMRNIWLAMVGIVAGSVLFAAWTGAVAHGLVAALGGRDAETTVKLYLVLTAFYLLLWIPYVNLFVLFYGAVATVRGLEEAQDLTFYRALLVAIVAPLVALAVPAALMMALP